MVPLLDSAHERDSESGTNEVFSSKLLTIERTISMEIPKNVGMLLLGIWLIVSGVITLVPAIYFNGLGTIMAILAVAAGIFILMRK